MESPVALLVAGFLDPGKPLDLSVSVHRRWQVCKTAPSGWKFGDNSYPFAKVLHQENIEIPQGLCCGCRVIPRNDQ
nr:hypothetical protein [Escherichia coli]